MMNRARHNWLLHRWRCQGGYREVLKIAVPLVLSTSAWSIQFMVDRMFLTWYSREAVSASMQASMVWFTVLALFLATASYCNTFVAQYVGAGLHRRVGAAVWQAIFFSIVSGTLMLALMPAAGPLFRLIGHSPDVQKLEVIYFRIMLGGSAFLILGDAVSSFFSGRGETWTIMWVNFASVGLNILLNRLWIFGGWGFPEMGIAGAAWATVAAYLLRTVIFFILMIRRKHREKYGTLSGCRFDGKIFRRLLRFGLPSGVTFSLEILVWTLFVALVGKLGITEMAATTVAFQINSLAFMPMMGIGMAVSIMVGQRMGREAPDLAARSTWSAVHLTVLYMGVIALMYWLMPNIFIAPFGLHADAGEFLPISRMVATLLKFVAFYTLFDGIYIVVSGALKGAGDTRFPVAVTLAFSWTVLAIPIFLLYRVGRLNIWLAWLFATAYVVLVTLALLARFLWGKWRTMRVIEEVPPHVTPHPSVPPIDLE